MHSCIDGSFVPDMDESDKKVTNQPPETKKKCDRVEQVDNNDFGGVGGRIVARNLIG